MRCPYYKITADNGKKVASCSLFDGIGVDWQVQCRKCIESAEARMNVWAQMVGRIRENLFSQIPAEWQPTGHCPHHGNVLDGIFEITRCCGGKERKEPKYECLKDNKSVTVKECLECLAQQK